MICFAGALFAVTCWVAGTFHGYLLGCATRTSRVFVQTCPPFLHFAYTWVDGPHFKPGPEVKRYAWSRQGIGWFTPARQFAGFGVDANDWGGVGGAPKIHARSLTVPYWFLVVVLIAAAVRAGRSARRERAARRRGLCPSCGYDLRATPDRCPECGATAPALQQLVN